eukprot:TRINITY_DN23483_c0_g1_i1.p1 TRINITY_DN23483_c0_g1~~TRINITY_DN23483_c0_g1_i1.p1  ORF type:complete len:127 (-),score=19.85 TRINITY_DN23483_c0_g1_i1:138-485(-)
MKHEVTISQGEHVQVNLQGIITSLKHAIIFSGGFQADHPLSKLTSPEEETTNRGSLLLETHPQETDPNYFNRYGPFVTKELTFAGQQPFVSNSTRTATTTASITLRLQPTLDIFE